MTNELTKEDKAAGNNQMGLFGQAEEVPAHLRDSGISTDAGMESLTGVGVLNFVIAQGMAEVFKKNSEEYIEDARPGDLYERGTLKQVFKELDVIPVKAEPMYREYGKLDEKQPSGIDYKHFGGFHHPLSDKVTAAKTGPKWGTLLAADDTVLQTGIMFFFLLDGYPATYFAFSYSTDVVKNFAARCRLNNQHLFSKKVRMSAVPVPKAAQGDPYQIKLEALDWITAPELEQVKEYLEHLDTENKLILVANNGRTQVSDNAPSDEAATAKQEAIDTAANALVEEDLPAL